MIICAGLSLPIWAFYMFLGTALFVFYQVFPTPESLAMLSGDEKAEGILPYFIIHQLPPGVVGIVIAAALAAAMSSLDSSINAISTVSIVDIYKRHIKPNREDKHYLRVAWLIATIVSIAMMAGANLLLTAETKTLQDTATILASLLSGGLLGMYLLAFFTKKGDARAVWTGVIATLIFTFWTVCSKKGWLPEAMQFPFDLYYTGLIGNILMFTIGFAAAGFWKQKNSQAVYSN